MESWGEKSSILSTLNDLTPGREPDYLGTLQGHLARTRQSFKQEVRWVGS